MRERERLKGSALLACKRSKREAERGEERERLILLRNSVTISSNGICSDLSCEYNKFVSSKLKAILFSSRLFSCFDFRIFPTGGWRKKEVKKWWKGKQRLFVSWESGVGV